MLGSAAAFESLLVEDGVWPLHTGTIIRMSAYEACGGYRRDITMPLDLGLWLGLALQGGFAYSPLILVRLPRAPGADVGQPPKIKQNTVEVVRVIRDACREAERRGLGLGRLKRNAIRNHLAAAALSDAFGAQRSVALHRWLAAVKECPVETMSSKKLWTLVLRASLGKDAFDFGRKAWLKATGRPDNAEVGPESS